MRFIKLADSINVRDIQLFSMPDSRLIKMYSMLGRNKLIKKL